MPVCLPVCSWRFAARSRPLLRKTFAAALGAALVLLEPAHGDPAMSGEGGASARGGLAVTDDSIVVRGNRRIDAAAIREHFRGSPAARVEPKAVNTALKELYATGLFDDVKIARSGATLIVTVVEAPTIEHLRFTGNSKIKDKDLESAVTSKSRGPYTKAAVANDVARLIEAYRAIGRFEAEVTAKTIARGEGRLDLVFQINEGEKTGVKRIAFAGNRSFRDDRLRSVIKTTESGWFAFLKTSDVYDPDRIESDSDLLRRFYLKNGFADVRVTADGAYDANAKGFTVTFSIDEGERFRLGAIAITSRVEGLDGAALRSIVALAPGAVFDGEAVDKAADGLTIALGQRGYPFAAVRPHLVRNAGVQTVDLLFTIDNGPRQYIERIAIRGNTVTRDDVIRREFELAEGDAFNRALVERAEKRLRALGILKSAKIAVAPGSAPDRVVLNVEVEEERTGDLALSGGYSTSAGFIGEISVSEHNLLGTGAYAKVAGTLGQYQRGAELSFAEPYFLGSRMTVGVDLFYRDTLTSSTQSYGSTYYGATLKLDAPLLDGVTARARYSLMNQSLSLDPALMDCSSANPPPVCMYNGEASAAVKQAVLNGPQWVSTIGSTVAYSSVDNPKAPHEGLRAELRQDVAGLGGDADFLKTTGDVRYYHDLGSDVVAMARGQGGYVLPYGNQPLPFVSGFFGGPQFVRGFAPNGFGPRDLTAYTTQDNIGGSQFWASTAELQSPIPGLPPEIALKAAVFADAGSLWGYRGQTYFPALSPSLMAVGDSRQIRSSIGSSLIWDSSFGPLRVDYAYPISKASYDVTQRVHFGFGGF
jgi:outer membrane protein insertion porin family